MGKETSQASTSALKATSMRMDGLQHVCNDQASPDVCVDDHGRAPPHQVPSPFPCEGHESPCTLPSSGGESSDLGQRHDRRIAHRGEGLSQDSSLATDLSHGICCLMIPSPQPHQPIDRVSRLVRGMQECLPQNRQPRENPAPRST